MLLLTITMKEKLKVSLLKAQLIELVKLVVWY